MMSAVKVSLSNRNEIPLSILLCHIQHSTHSSGVQCAWINASLCQKLVPHKISMGSIVLCTLTCMYIASYVTSRQTTTFSLSKRSAQAALNIRWHVKDNDCQNSKNTEENPPNRHSCRTLLLAARTCQHPNQISFLSCPGFQAAQPTRT